MEKLSEVFSIIPSGISIENFVDRKKKILDNKFVSKSAIEFMNEKGLIKVYEEKFIL